MPDQATTEHLLRRTEYVARPARVAELLSLGLEQAVDNVLTPVGPVALPAYLDHNIEGEGWNQYVAAMKWWFDRMAFDSPRPVHEKMTFFWHGHFTS
ncbi:MAG TPA: DUF1800 family protein, partial [Ilumatobacteraceae bacterium]|nr:DUF1800 family protein [Ilumatobacteraceae bacterium]